MTLATREVSETTETSSPKRSGDEALVRRKLMTEEQLAVFDLLTKPEISLTE